MAVDYNQISNTIRKTRKLAGLSQQELAVLAGVGKTVVYDIEKGKMTIRLETLAKICRALNIRINFQTPELKV